MTVRRQQPQVLLVSVPGDVTGVSARDASKPIVARALLLRLLPVDRSPVHTLAVRVGAGVPWVAQRPHRGRCRERTEDHARGGGAEPRGEAEAFVSKRLDRLVRRAGPGEGLEEVRDRFPHLRIRIEHNGAALVVDHAGGKDASVLAAPDLVQDPAAQSRLQDVQLCLAHRSLEAEKEPVVGVRRLVHAILVEDQGVRQRADLEQPMPVGVVPREPRDLESHHNAGPPKPDVRHQPPKPLAPRRGCPRLSLVGVDHNDAIVGPAERRCARSKRVLPLGALDVLDDLLHRRLSDVQVRVTLKMVRLDFARFVHGSSVRCASSPSRRRGERRLAVRHRRGGAKAFASVAA